MLTDGFLRKILKMPVQRKMMDELKKRYGEDRGEDVYFALEQKQKNKKKKSVRQPKDRSYD